ncbi:deoxyuridine 5'-triphosphate nucleotidohydrolase [Chloroflexota bacterium]
MGSILSKKEVAALINSKPPLLEDYLNLAVQLQPGGFDCSLKDVARLDSAGVIPTTNQGRVIAETSPLAFDRDGFLNLSPGCYIITLNEVVNIPKDITALAFPRSSLLRCGVTVNSAVWDAGYSGRSRALMTVQNPLGFHIQQNARLIQMVFFRMDSATEGYNGIYQGENI